jgi:cytochrome c556
MNAKHSLGRAAVAGALTVLVATMALVAQQQPAPNTQKPAPETQKPAPETQKPAPAATPTPPPAKPLVPLAASTLATKPDNYYGESVTITAPVDQKVGTLSFSLDQDPKTSTGKDVLVLAPRLNEPVDANGYVTVLGEVVKFDPAEIGKRKEYAAALTPDLAAKFQGKPVVLATAVINSAGVDLAKRLPAPMTPQEEEFDKLMKKIGPANAELRKGMEASNTDLAKQNASVLKDAFGDVASFWRSQNKPDAVQWAQDARKIADSIERAAADGKWEEVKASAGNLGKTCQSCHGIYRERFDDGTFRIKAGG